jgi:MFS family permease
LRAFLYGFGSVLIGHVLAAGGFSDTRVGVVFTAMLAGMALSSVVIGRTGDAIGRRRAYRGLFFVLAGAGAVFALTHSLLLLVLASLTGTLSTDPNESGPITSLEQAMLGVAPAEERARVFGRYNAVAYLTGSLGALAAGGPAAFRRFFPGLPADQRFLFVFPALALVCVALTGRLSDRVEAERIAGGRPLQRSRGTVRGLAALFAVDAFAGGFVVQTFLAFWFDKRFHAGPAITSLVFFGTGLLQALSSIVAGRIAQRVGLLNTMVFTHLPSNVLLAAVPFSPVLGGAIVLLLARSALSQMDVPTRQAYVIAMVDPHERTAAAAYTNTARYVVRPAGPLAATALMAHVSLSAPFLAAGGLKVLYDLALYATFRRVPIDKPSGSP